MKLVWSKTGDELELEVLNQNLFYSWLDFVNSKNANTFYCDRESIQDLYIISKDLRDVLQKVNDYLHKTNRSLPYSELSYGQPYLNLLHRQWVDLQIDVPGIKSFLELNKNGSSKEFDLINDLIHAIEHRTKFPFFTSQYHEFDNPYSKDIESMTARPGHIFLSYKNLGRTCWHKYSFGDENYNSRDTNNWDILGTDIVVDISPLRHFILPQDYVDKCKQHGVPAVGLELPLAKFIEPIDWAILRTIFRKNILKPENSFSFIS
jgi:hypothetical protein